MPPSSSPPSSSSFDRPPSLGLFGLWHLALNVRSLEPMERFYVGIMGFQVEWRPDPENVYLTSGRDNLALHVARGLPPPGQVGVLDHIGVFVPTLDAVDAWYAHLKSAGVQLDTAPRTHRDGARSFYARDPEQNRLQILFHRPVLEALTLTAR